MTKSNLTGRNLSVSPVYYNYYVILYYVIIGLINEGETEMIKSKIKNLNELTKGYANKNSNPLLYGGQPKTETQTYRMDINEYRKLVEKGEGTNEPMTCRKILPGEIGSEQP